MQFHVHEFVFSTETVHEHSHRVAGVTGEAIGLPNGNHFHFIKDNNTTFEDEHFHQVMGATGPAIKVSEDDHVHYVAGSTTIADEDAPHSHPFDFATLAAPNIPPGIKPPTKRNS